MRELPKYVLLSPVGEHKLYAFEDFIKSVNEFRHKPDLIFLAIDQSIIKEVVEILENNNEISYRIYNIGYSRDIPGDLNRISKAREILRKEALKTNYNWFLWLDSDIISPPELPEKLFETALEKRYCVVVNGYPGRSERNILWHGSGVMVTNRVALDVGRFIPTGRETVKISEDYNFFSMVRGAEPFLLSQIGYKGVLQVNLVKVKHYLSKNWIK